MVLLLCSYRRLGVWENTIFSYQQNKVNLLYEILYEILRLRIKKYNNNEIIKYWAEQLTKFYHYVIQTYTINTKKINYTFKSGYNCEYCDKYVYNIDLKQLEKFILNNEKL